MVPEGVDRELGELSTKIDGLTQLITTSVEGTNRAIEQNRAESSSRHDRLYGKFEETTAALSNLRTDHETLKKDHTSSKAETHRSVGRLWKVLLSLSGGSAAIVGILKAVSS